MTPTIEGNKLIAEFMGGKVEQFVWRKYEPMGVCFAEQVHGLQSHLLHDLEYHTSWDWLMPVVEKISNIHYPDYWNGRQPDDVGEWDNCAYPRTFGMRDSEGNYMVRFNANVLYSAKTLIEATWLAVIEFIKDYNITENQKQ